MWRRRRFFRLIVLNPFFQWFWVGNQDSSDKNEQKVITKKRVWQKPGICFYFFTGSAASTASAQSKQGRCRTCAVELWLLINFTCFHSANALSSSKAQIKIKKTFDSVNLFFDQNCFCFQMSPLACQGSERERESRFGWSMIISLAQAELNFILIEIREERWTHKGITEQWSAQYNDL